MLVQNPARTRRLLENFNDLGVTVAMDDFGSGYSSPSYLRHFPIDNLKIDRSFVNGMTANTDDASITRAIISLARSLRLDVIAEGFERQHQFDYLLAEGCHQLQGYFYGRPAAADSAVRLLMGTTADPVKTAAR